VTAIDVSPELARLASAFSGQSCRVLAFQDMKFRAEFDGIWACASLLHVPQREMPDVLKRFAIALKPGGILYASLKEGDGERVAEDGRFFSYFRQEGFKTLLTQQGRFELVESWLTHAADSSGRSWPWLNFLATSKS
jgi:SAM-dependent methyltransferase